MATTWLTADLHLGHKGITTFVGKDGGPLRPWDDVATMHEGLLERWNARVRPSDKVYVLGDVAMPKSALALVPRFHGRKHLIMGNHDTHPIAAYAAVFEKVSALHKLPAGVVLSHVPLHPSSLSRYRGNVHGHLHDGTVQGEDAARYVCVSLEHWDFAPASIDAVYARLAEQLGH